MSSESSSDDDDMPLSALATKKSKSKSTSKTTKKERPQRRSSSRRASTTSSYKEADDGDEEFEFQDEEVAPPPKKKPPTKKRKSSKDASPAKKKTKTATKKKKTPKKSESSSSSSSRASSAIASASSELYAKSKKGKLISEFLRRWWYTMSWPDLEKNPIETPPNCDPMDGFPGVYVTTSGVDVGKLVDKRDKDTCPCFRNMAKKSSEELKELLVKAIEEQRKILIEHEGKGTQTEKDLNVLEKWANKVNCNAADKEAAKVLKAINIIIN